MIPSEIVAGDTVSWLDEPFADRLGSPIAPPEWTLKYAIRGKIAVDLVSVQEGSGWKTTLQPADTSDLTAVTTLYWQAYATKGSDKITLADGEIKVNPNLFDISSSTFDGRSQVKKDLDAVQAAIRNMISGGAVQEYTIGNRSVKKMTLSDLYRLESTLKADYAREKAAESIAKGLGNPNRVFVRFTK